MLIISNTLQKLSMVLLLISLFTKNYAANYVQVKAKNGDGMYLLFKKFDIPATSCNINHFKEINRLKSTKKLLIGKNYSLPILKYNYNGKSIATSINKIDRQTAQKIANYNKALVSKKIRKSSYTSTKIVWVLYDEINCDGQVKLKTSAQTKVVKSIPEITKSVIKESAGLKTNAVTKPLNIAPSKSTDELEIENLETPLANTLNSEKEVLAESVLKTRTVPIFGKDFEEIRIENNRLKDKVYYLVSGHGGPDPGTMYTGKEMTLCEDEYAYDVTLRLARKLMEQGANVHLIVQDPNDGIRNETYLPIDKDEKCITGYPLVLNQRLRLTQTTDAVNDLYRKYRNKGVAEKDQLAVHIHIDSRDADMRKDVYFYYQEENKYSLSIAKRLRRTMDRKYDEFSEREYTGTVSTRNLFVMRNTIAPTVFMELGNIQNQADHKRFIFSSNRQALAEWLYAGIVGEE